MDETIADKLSKKQQPTTLICSPMIPAYIAYDVTAITFYWFIFYLELFDSKKEDNKP